MVMMDKRLPPKGMEHRLDLDSQVRRLDHFSCDSELDAHVAGETIGCGVDFKIAKAFYTKNGAFLGDFV